MRSPFSPAWRRCFPKRLRGCGSDRRPRDRCETAAAAAPCGRCRSLFVMAQNRRRADARAGDQRADLLGESLLGKFIGIKHQDPVGCGVTQAFIARPGEIIAPGLAMHLRPRRRQQRHRAIDRSGIDDHELVIQTATVIKEFGDQPLFVAHDHTQAKACHRVWDPGCGVSPPPYPSDADLQGRRDWPREPIRAGPERRWRASPDRYGRGESARRRDRWRQAPRRYRSRPLPTTTKRSRPLSLSSIASTTVPTLSPPSA